MDRRRFCAGLLGGLVAGLSGCSALGRTGREGRESDAAGGTTTAATTTATATPGDVASLAETGIPSNICETEVREDFSIKEVVDPAFDTDWTGYDVSPKYTREDDVDGLTDGAVVVGREHDGRARAYPLSVLWFHEIVNDTFGVPTIVTYCSLCRTGLVADRRVRGEPTTFRVSGQLWKPPDRYITASAKAGKAFGADRWNVSDVPEVLDAANLVMYDDATRSYWSQAIAEGICGPMAGTGLPIVPSTLSSWGEWRASHPGTEILLPPPHSTLGP